MKRKSLFKIHRWIGLVAALWLFILGITGIFLDHDEWRWLRQTEVPESWLSSSMMRYLPATVMRFVAVDKNCLLYTSPSPRDRTRSRMPSSA